MYVKINDVTRHIPAIFNEKNVIKSKSFLSVKYNILIIRYNTMK